MENYVQETFADIEDEFCDNSDYVELKQAESEAVQFEERVCEEDDEFSWPVDGDGGVIGGVLQLEEDESECSTISGSAPSSLCSDWLG